MKIEHFAFNVDEPLKMCDWYVEHLGLTVVRKQEEAPFTVFLADSSRNVMIEIYKNPPEEVPDYKSMNPLLLHLAFVSKDPAIDKERLLKAGATLASDEKLENGSHLVMLRDPWGFSIQFCKRAKNMITENE
jgi:catechol 2,3-dioxygenase-like lactoylglutathione lyase family enzyme